MPSISRPLAALVLGAAVAMAGAAFAQPNVINIQLSE